MERFLDDDIVSEIIVGHGGWRFRRSGEGVRNPVGLASDVSDVAGKLADKEEVTLGSQGPGGGGVGLHDGAGQGFVIGLDDQLLPLMKCWNFRTAAATARSSWSKAEYRDSGSASRWLKKESGWSLP